jgi:DNA-binding GntR family transcriptional regulator
MRQLSVEGLTGFDTYRGDVACTPTLDEVREVYEIRLLLEPAAMRKAVCKR